MQPLAALLIGSLLTAAPLSPSQDERTVDFANFSYPVDDGWCVAIPKTGCVIRLVDGHNAPPPDLQGDDVQDSITASIGFVRYGDLTGDDIPEAVVQLGWNTGGTGLFSALYVFDISRQPRLLHRFPEADRSPGGYWDACAKAGELVVITAWTTRGFADLDGFQTTRYRWTRESFHEESRRLDRFSSSALPLDFTDECGNQPLGSLGHAG